MADSGDASSTDAVPDLMAEMIIQKADCNKVPLYCSFSIFGYSSFIVNFVICIH